MGVFENSEFARTQIMRKISGRHIYLNYINKNFFKHNIGWKPGFRDALRSANITFLSIADPIKYREAFNSVQVEKNAFTRGCPEFCRHGIVNAAAFIPSNWIVKRQCALFKTAKSVCVDRVLIP